MIDGWFTIEKLLPYEEIRQHGCLEKMRVDLQQEGSGYDMRITIHLPRFLTHGLKQGDPMWVLIGPEGYAFKRMWGDTSKLTFAEIESMMKKDLKAGEP